MSSLMIASPYSGQALLPNGSAGISADPQDTTRILGSISDNANVRQQSFLDKLLGVASDIIGNISINKSGGNVSVVRTTDPTAQAVNVRIPGTYDPNESAFTAVAMNPLVWVVGAAVLYIALKE